jgi:hypothetical protein
MHQWVNHLNKAYIDLYGPKIKVFRLDKTVTQKHELYLEEKQSGRIYLPPIELRSLHDDGKWRGSLGMNLYSETEPPMVMYINFEDMVQKMTEARRRHIANVYIKYHGQGVPTIQKKDNKLSIWIGKQKKIDYDLDDKRYSTIRKLGSHIHSFDDFEIELEGENDLSRNLIDFERTNFSGRQVLIYTEDTAYNNVSDVIEMGDVILTNKYRLYEVQDAAPAGNFGWNYTTWKIECKLATVENMNLPGNYVEQIKRNEYGLRPKTRME